MALTVRCFASWADAFGPEVQLEFPPAGTVGDLLRLLGAHPEAARLPRPMIAVNRRYAREESVIQPGDEVAVIPPVAGG